MSNPERFVAIHEAGHVVAQFIFADCIPEGFQYVTVVPDKDQGSLGHVRLHEMLERKDPSLFEFDFDDEENQDCAGFSQRELEARLSASLAGEAATYLEVGTRDDVGTGRDSWSGDFAHCMNYLERIFPVGDDPEEAGNQAAYHYLEALFWRTVLLLRRRGWWEKVEAIASALMEKQTLTAEECKEVAFPPDHRIQGPSKSA